MNSTPKDFKIWKKNSLDIFVIMVPLEIFSNYPDIDISYWLKEDVQWSMDKVFREKLVV